MFASIKINAFFTGLIVTGCVCSPEFAAAVVAGAFGTFIAALVIFGIHGGPEHPVGKLIYKGRQFIRL